MPGNRWLSEDELEVWYAYILFSRQLAAGMERQLADSGVSGADYQMLAPLAEARPQGMRPRDLGRSAGWDRSRLAHQLRRMEQRGLVSREPSGDDRRGTVVRITEAGLTALRRATPGHLTWVREHFIGLMTPDEKRMLVDVSRRVMAHLEDRTPR